jgi:hypothetical protein
LPSAVSAATGGESRALQAENVPCIHVAEAELDDVTRQIGRDLLQGGDDALTGFAVDGLEQSPAALVALGRRGWIGVMHIT